MARGAFALRTLSRMSASCSGGAPAPLPALFSLLTLAFLPKATDNGRLPESGTGRLRRRDDHRVRRRKTAGSDIRPRNPAVGAAPGIRAGPAVQAAELETGNAADRLSRARSPADAGRAEGTHEGPGGSGT
ncbi:hypothetical protein GCM10010512_10330 [Streptomyces thermoviolaceus subsp. thermoviolaceus]|nr:hypothetical protein GCM10010512_10330 [Streptomyces thermoviolaceus subsp. thermoviolaceus]